MDEPENERLTVPVPDIDRRRFIPAAEAMKPKNRLGEIKTSTTPNPLSQSDDENREILVPASSPLSTGIDELIQSLGTATRGSTEPVPYTVLIPRQTVRPPSFGQQHRMD